MSVGSRIKELRESKGMSRNDLATKLGVTVGSISNYENEVSSPKEPILFKIMDALGCDGIKECQFYAVLSVKSHFCAV